MGLKVRHYPPFRWLTNRLQALQSIGAVSVTQTLAPAPVTVAWTVPSQSVTGSGSGTVTASPVVVTWRVPPQGVTGGIPLAQQQPWWLFEDDSRAEDGPMFNPNKCLNFNASDSANLIPYVQNNLMTQAIYVGTTGDVVAVLSNDVLATFTAVPAGWILPVAAKRVNATNTTAGAFVALYQV